VQEIFQTTYETLMRIAELTGLSYKEVNVVVWYMLIPFIWAALLGVITRRKVFMAVVAATSLIFCLSGFSKRAEWLFDRSVVFLEQFAVVGAPYVEASVLVCLVAPAVVTLLLAATACYRLARDG